MGKLFSVSQLQQEVPICFAFTVFCAHAVIVKDRRLKLNLRTCTFSPELFWIWKENELLERSFLCIKLKLDPVCSTVRYEIMKLCTGLRWVLGYFLSQKCTKVRSYFSMKKGLIVKVKWSVTRLWPKFLTQKIEANIWKTKFADITPNVWKSKKGASVRADFVCDEVSKRVEKKSSK